MNYHTLVEFLYCPLQYKQKVCPDKIEGQSFTCSKRGDLCSLYHSTQEKENANKVIRKGIKEMPKNESMNMFISILDEVKKEGSKTNSNSKNSKNIYE